MHNPIHKQLQAQTKEWLVDRLAEFARDDAICADRISLYLAAQKSAPEAIADFKFILDKFTREVKDHGGYDWRNQLPTTPLWNVWEALSEAFRNGKDAVVLEVAEYALLQIYAINGLQDECELEGPTEQLRKLHVDACKKLELVPEEFGRQLSALANQTEWGLFDGPPSEYAEVLGEVGLLSYKAGLKKRK